MTSGQYPPKIPPSGLPKRTFPSFSVRRSGASITPASASASTLNLPRTAFSTTSVIAAVAASPTSPTSSNHTVGSGKSVSFRSLRNLLPFGGSTKSPQSNDVLNTPSRSFSVGFASVRRSINVSREKEEKGKDRNRKFSLSNEALLTSSVISIEPKLHSGTKSTQVPKGGDQSPTLRRSVSFSRLEGEINLEKPLPEPVLPDLSLRDAIEANITLMSLRTPSPPPSPEHPPTRYHHPVRSQSIGMSMMNHTTTIAPAELSTIIEADNSGISISKHIPLSPSASPEPLSPSTREEDYTIRRQVFQHAASSSNNTTPLMTSSPLQPSSPVQHERFSPHSISIDTGTTPTASTPTSPPTNPFGSNKFGPSNDSEDVDDNNVSEQLSTSQLASQVQAALASTSWGGSSDRAFVIDADTSFIQMHDEDRVRTPSESETSSFADGDGECHLITNMGREGRIVDVNTEKNMNVHDKPDILETSFESSFLSSPPNREHEDPRSYDEIEDDETSRINNSTLSVVNPNHLLRTLATQEEVSLNLSSLDPDLRDIVRGQIQNQQRQGKSSTLIGSSSGRTMKLSSPASAHPSMLQSTVEPGASRSVSSPITMIPRTTPSFPGLSPHLHNATRLSLSHGPTSVSNSTPALKGIPALAPTTVTMSKRRIASSSFLPRLKPSLSPGSQSFSIPSLETKNSKSSRKTDLPGSGVGAGIDGGNGSKIPQSSAPRIAVFSPIQASINSSSSFSATASIPAITKPGTRRSFGSVGVGAGNPAGGGQKQNQQQRSKTTDKNASDGVARVNAVSQVGQVVPQVTVVETSENDLQTTSDLSTKSDSVQDSNLTNIPATIVDIRQERGDAHTWPVTRYDEGEDEDDTRRLTVDVRSQRVTGEESVRLGLPFTSAKVTTEGIQAPSPLSVHAPLPSHHHQHHSYHRNSCHSATPITPIAPDPTPTTIRLLVPNPSSSPMSPPQPLLPSPIVPGSSSPSISNGLDQGGSLGANNATQGIVVGANTGEDSGEKMFYGGSSNGRPSRRVPAPLRLSLGGASNTSAGNNGISIHAGPTNYAADGTGLDIPERRPSPLRSTVQFDSRGNSEYFDTSHYHHHHSTDGRTSTRPSIDDSSSVRPSLFMEQNRPLDSPMHSLSHMRRDSPDFTYQKYVVDRERESRPLVRSKDHERDRDKEHQRDGPVVRMRKRSMSVQGNHGCNCAANANTIGNLGAGGLMGGSVINLSSAAMSARERLARARYGDLGGGARPWSSLSMRSAGRTENLLSRDHNHATKPPFYDKEIGPGIEKSVSDRTTAEHGRERSGSTSGIGTLGRYAPLRNASEYNFAHGRRESLVSGSMDSPTFTISTSASGSGSVSGGTTTTTGGASGSGTGSNRGDTPRSTSTGATSVSTTISNTNKDHERDREDLRELKEKHATETGALLSALSDSQRTSRMLREENTELRERLGGVERDNERLRCVVRELEREVMVVVREREREREKEKTWDTRSTLTGLNNSAGPGAVSASWRGYATPMTKQRDAAMVSRPAIRMNASRLNLLERGLDQGGISDTTMIRRSQRSKLDNILFPKEMESRELESNVYSEGQKRAHNDEGELIMPVRERAIYSNDNIVPDLEDRSFGSTIVPPSSNVNVNTTCTIRRRPSTSSSIFPVPPSNMTMLLHDEMGLPSGLEIEGNQSNVTPGPTKLPESPPMSISYNSRFPTAIVQSAASNVSVSPTMENLSMVTGSPGSLFLKPEHEMMLDEMESLDLGRNMSSVVANED